MSFVATKSAQVASRAAQRKVKQTSFVKKLFTDAGNAPLVAANAAGAGLIFVFAGRKLFFHPDVSITAQNRLHEDTDSRAKDTNTFRKQHAFFASILEPLSVKMVSNDLGGAPSSRWNLSFSQTPAEDLVPLEKTNYFNDSLYESTFPTSFSMNENNPDMTKSTL